MRLSVAVQHHPSRAELLPVPNLDDPELVVDPEPDARPYSPFRCYLEALRRTPADATHRLIVQDDALPCAGFGELAAELVAQCPEHLLAFFVPGRSSLRGLINKAHAQGQHLVQLPNLNWTPTVALCWPVDLAREFLPYGEGVVASRARRGLTTQGDDPYVGEWRKKRKLPVYASVPCLVQHPDVVQSLFRPGLKPKAGANRSRVAALYVDEACPLSS